MEITDHIHWFLTSRCNLNCSYCFKPRSLAPSSESETQILKLADILVDGGVKMVTLGGGEPMLVEALNPLVEKLKHSGLYVSLHTNGTFLDEERVAQLASYVNDVALPLDSLNSDVQDSFGREKNHVTRFKRQIEQIGDAGIQPNIHTVASLDNIGEMPSIYRFLKSKKFGYWRIYEFNEDMIDDKFSGVNRFQEVMGLAGQATESDYRDGGVKSLLGRFLLMEERMKKHKDKRVQFVGKRDKKAPYVFLDNSGDVRYCTYFTTERKTVGNLFRDGFLGVQGKLKEALKQGVFFDEDGFINSFQDMPLFARLWEGNYWTEEVDGFSNPQDASEKGIDQRYAPTILRLEGLYSKRMMKQERQLDKLYEALAR
jgi:MoaA/NifB/PqqE/SkfB family radical SAM enzyme